MLIDRAQCVIDVGKQDWDNSSNGLKLCKVTIAILINQDWQRGDF